MGPLPVLFLATVCCLTHPLFPRNLSNCYYGSKSSYVLSLYDMVSKLTIIRVFHFWTCPSELIVETVKNMSVKFREQDGGGAGGHGVHLSTWIHQEYTLRQRSACRTPSESEGGNRTGSILKAGLHPGLDYGLWAIHPVSMEMTYQPENQAPGRKSPRALHCLKEYPNYLCNWIESYILLCLLGYDHGPIDNCPLLTT